MELKGSKTEKNLLAAFAGESQARNRYSYFAKQACKEGYQQIGAIFTETEGQERQHAKRLFNFLQGGEVEITAEFPAGTIGATIDNLKASVAGEDYETSDMYPKFAGIAEEEGFSDIASVFRSIAVAEARHRDRYQVLADNIAAGSVFKRAESQRWACRKCGYVHEGAEAPDECPACTHPQAYFEIDAINY